MKRNAEAISDLNPTKVPKKNNPPPKTKTTVIKRNETIIRARPILSCPFNVSNPTKGGDDCNNSEENVKPCVKAFQIVNSYYQKEEFQKMQGGVEGLTSKLIFRSDIDEIIARYALIFAPGITEKAQELSITEQEVIDVKDILTPPFMMAYQYQQLVKTDTNAAANLLIEKIKKFDGLIDSKLNRVFKVEFLAPVYLNKANCLFFESLIEELCVPFIPGGINKAILPDIVTEYNF